MTTNRKTPRYSFLVNFFVLTLVFAVIFTLQHSRQTQTEITPPVSVVVQPTEPQIEEVKTQIIEEAKLKAVTTIEPTPEPEKKYLPIPTTQPNKTVVILSENKKEVKETKSENITFTELKPIKTVSARELSVDILDGETARQHYLAANKTGIAAHAIEPKRNLGNFIPFEK